MADSAGGMQAQFGARLTYHRNLRGMSQAALARKLGVDRSTVSKWESEDRPPGVDDLPNIANALGVTIAELFLPVPETDD